MSIILEKAAYVYAAGTPFEHQALKDISLQFDRGTITGIIGTTGAGKSTLLQLLNGLLLPKSGRVLVEGQDTTKLGKRELLQLRQKVGLVFQFPEKQLFESTVEADIAFAPRQLKLPQAEVQNRVEQAMATVGLDKSLAKRAPSTLSSGQKRMAAIAGVLAMQPRFLALDEPTAGLDFNARNSLWEILRSINRQNQTTIIIVSHSLAELAELCTHLALMKEGRILIAGRTAEVLSERELLMQQGFELPLWSEIIWQLKQKGWNISPAHDTASAAKAISAALKNNSKHPWGITEAIDVSVGQD
jgi:energy-coupling factor transport system ATP-binding protein